MSGDAKATIAKREATELEKRTAAGLPPRPRPLRPSGDDVGRTPGERSLTQLLVKKLDQTTAFKGHALSGKALIAELVVETLLTGKIPFLTPPFNQITAKEWIHLVTWLYQYVDPPLTRLANADGSNIRIVVEVDGNGDE